MSFILSPLCVCVYKVRNVSGGGGGGGDEEVEFQVLQSCDGRPNVA